LHEKQSKNKAV